MMTNFFVNLKRFDVPASLGGICQFTEASKWARWIMEQTAELKLHEYSGVRIVYFFPESLLIPAADAAAQLGISSSESLQLGSQGVHRENVSRQGNFGAFTTMLPAAAAVSAGCSWALIGHSEQRKNLLGLFSYYDDTVLTNEVAMQRANRGIHRIINQEVLRAFESGMDVLLCMGETLEERGDGSSKEQQSRLEAVLREQVRIGLKDAAAYVPERSLAIGYEPRWAIGPGKTPPDAQYIECAAAAIRTAAEDLYGLDVQVVYGGGLKEENAREISRIPSVEGGLVALTKFTDPIGFSPEGLKEIIDAAVSV